MSALQSFSKGSRVRIHHFESGFAHQRRLSALGLTPGAEIRIFRNDGVCPLIVAVRGARFMLGRSLCKSIYAEALDEDEASA